MTIGTSVAAPAVATFAGVGALRVALFMATSGALAACAPEAAQQTPTASPTLSQPTPTPNSATPPPPPASSVTTQQSPSPTAGPIISPADAIAAVLEFAPDAVGLQAHLVAPGPPCACYQVETPDIHGFVDAVTGAVVTLFIATVAPLDTTVAVNAAQAVAAARSFLNAHGIPIPAANPTVELRDHGETNEYQVVWQRRVDGIKVPDAITLSVNPKTGAVYSLVRNARQWVDPPAPVLSLAQAITAAKVAAGPGLTVVHSSDLVVAFDLDGTQRLLYQVELESAGGQVLSVAMVVVDAITGVATVIGRG